MAFEINGVDFGPDVQVASPEREIIEVADIPLDAGLHVVGVRFLNDYYCNQERFDAGQCNDQGDRNLLVDWLEVNGPNAGSDGPSSTFEAEWFADCDLTATEDSQVCTRAARTICTTCVAAHTGRREATSLDPRHHRT